jgi:hypothetical protein
MKQVFVSYQISTIFTVIIQTLIIIYVAILGNGYFLYSV